VEGDEEGVGVTSSGEHPWESVGSAVVHSTFGTGVVVKVGQFKGVPAVWIDFDRGDRKTLLTSGLA